MLLWPEQLTVFSVLLGNACMLSCCRLQQCILYFCKFVLVYGPPTAHKALSSSTLAETSPVIIRGLKDLGAYAISTRSKVIEEYMHS